MKKVFFIMVVPLTVLVSPIHGDVSPLQITISLKSDPTYEYEMRHTQGRFAVITEIINVHDQEQNFQVWSCSYGLSWISDREEILTGLESCPANILQNISLKPQEKYRRNLTVALAKGDKRGTLDFKLAFIPKLNDLKWRSEGRLPLNAIWSNALAIEVKSGMQKFLPEKIQQRAADGIMDVQPAELNEMSPDVKKLMIKTGAKNIPPPCPEGTVLEGQHCRN